MKSKLEALHWPLLFVTVAAIIGWRSSSYLAAPVLRAEDGSKVFEFFYEHRAVDFLLRFKAGYIPLLPNILGWLSVRLPPRLTPYLLTCAPTLLAAFTTSALGLRAFRPYVASDPLRAAVCLGLAIAPPGPMMTVSNTDYSIWNALLLVLLLALLPMPKNRLGSVAFACALGVLIWSHPLTIVALPATLLHLWRERGVFARVLHGLIAVCQGAHVWLGTHPDRAAFAKNGGPIQRSAELVKGVLEHVCNEVVEYTVLPWRPEAAWCAYAVTALFMLGLLACALRAKTRLVSPAFCAWLAYGIVVPMALVVFSRDERGLNASRYHYVSRAFAEIGCALLLAQLIWELSRLVPKLPRGTLLPAACAVAYVGLTGVVSGRSAHFEEPESQNAELVRKFFADLADAQQEHGGHCNIRLRCNKRHGDWPFGVDTRKACE